MELYWYESWILNSFFLVFSSFFSFANVAMAMVADEGEGPMCLPDFVVDAL